MTLTRRSLEDLWEAGKDYDLSPNEDGSAMVYIRKLGPTQQGEAVRMANAERAKVSLVGRDPEDERYIVLKAEVEEMEREDMIEKLAQTKVQEERSKLEQEISEKEEWSNDGYLQSLVDAWEGGLMESFFRGEDDLNYLEGKKCLDEITRFNEEVGSKLEVQLSAARREIERFSTERLVEKTMEAQFDYEASLAWMRTFRLYQIMFGVHTTDRERMFETIDEVASLPAELFGRIVNCLTDLTTPAADVKS